MEIEKLIEQMDEQGHQWLADEMRLYDENPDYIISGNLVPNFENIDPNNDMALAQLYFYVGTAYGVGLSNKHDL